ncbi:MAG: hypothetical protein IK143_04825 [Bacteroidales bacterium]|nr:hypothetical protein [Bacteroidales bacterium]
MKYVNYLMQEQEITCLECGTEFYGRVGKKFCSPTCKNSWHNRARRDSSLIRRTVESSIERNYKILTRLLKLGIHSMDKMECSLLGYKFECVTGYTRAVNHDVFSVFDIRYALSSTRLFSLERITVPTESENY